MNTIEHMNAVAGDSWIRNLCDRLIFPGALGFTRFGYQHRKRSWSTLPSLSGQTVVITGATSGLGLSAALTMVKLDARLILVGRNEEKLKQVCVDLQNDSNPNRVRAEIADLSLMSEVRALARRLKEREPVIDVLINNAAVLPVDRRVTAEGLELAFATDLLSPYLLTELLLPTLRHSSPARVINVLSGGMYLSGLNVKDLQSQHGNYNGSRAYAQAKRGLMVLTEHWANRLQNHGVVFNAMHPGWADTPGVEQSLPGFHKVMRNVLRTPEQGADTIVWLAAAKEAAVVNGKLWLDREPHLSSILPGTAGAREQRDALLEALYLLARENT
jgi:NAD(P)-dependent dehydrogenase (short-subunit alcohol dehydrogenase family)